MERSTIDSALRHVLVIGAGLGGLRTIEALRSAGFAGRITLVGAETHLPYDRPPLSKQVLAGEWEHGRTALIDTAGLSDLSVEAVLGNPVTELSDGHATLADGTVIAADAVVICTGVSARTIAGQSEGFHTLRTLDDAIALRARLETAASLLIVGAGFIGTEIASSAAKLGVEVSILESLAVPFARTLGPELGAVCARLLTEHGIDLRCAATVSEFSDTDSQVQVLLSDGTEIRADVGVVGIGGVPDLHWLTGSGVSVDNGIQCDEQGKAVGCQNVWALGDVASWLHGESGLHHRSEHWNSTLDQARIVASSVLQLPVDPPTVPYFWSDQFGLKIQVVGRIDIADPIVELHGCGLSGGVIKGTLVGHFHNTKLVAVTGFGAARLVARYRSAVTDQLDHSSVLAFRAGLDQPVPS